MEAVTYDLQACRSLGYAVLLRAVRDIKRPSIAALSQREDAVRFVKGDGAACWCEALGVDVSLLRDALEPGGTLHTKGSD